MPAPVTSGFVQPGNVLALFERLDRRRNDTVLIADDAPITGRDLLEQADGWERALAAAGVGPGELCAYTGDYDLATVSLLLALMRIGAVAVPLTHGVSDQVLIGLDEAGTHWMISVDGAPHGRIVRRPPLPENPIVQAFAKTGRPGLVVFTSGSSGRPKAILHDLDRVLGKFVNGPQRRGWRTILFLLMDHFGGINTLFGTLTYGGIGICVPDRSVRTICRAIEQHRAELLPTSPSFLNLMIASGTWAAHHLSSVALVTYGTEPMPDLTLNRARGIFPQARFKQTYGMSEIGVVRSRSPDPTSLWLEIGGDGFETRVVDGVLHIRSASSMVGYLNAPSPIDADGWMNTGDLVEQRDGAFRFVGRVSDIVNVGGQKVFPAEVEAVLLQAPNVVDATVLGRRHPILGNMVVARVSLAGSEPAAADRLREHCHKHLAKFKVPMRFEFVDIAEQVGQRAKKQRSWAVQGEGGA